MPKKPKKPDRRAGLVDAIAGCDAVLPTLRRLTADLTLAGRDDEARNLLQSVARVSHARQMLFIYAKRTGRGSN